LLEQVPDPYGIVAEQLLRIATTDPLVPAGDSTFLGGDVNGNGLLDLTEAWLYRAVGTVPNSARRRANRGARRHRPAGGTPRT